MGGVARPNKYWVLIESPSVGGDKTFLSFVCNNVQLPGRSLQTTSQMIYSTARKFPYATLYDDLSLSFLCTNKMEEKKFFDTWQRNIINPVNGILNYYDSYVGQVLITTLDDEGNPSYTCYCEEAYPVTVDPIDLSYEENDTIMRLTVRFAMRKWTSYEDQAVNGNIPGLVEMPRETFSILDPITNTVKELLVPANLIGANDLFSSLKSLIPPALFQFDVGSIPFVGDFFRNFNPGKSVLQVF